MKIKKLHIVFLLLLLGNFITLYATIIPIDEMDKHHIRLIENKGQWESNVLFRGHIPGGILYITKEGLTYKLTDQQAEFEALHNHKVGTVIKSHVYKVNFKGANSNPTFSKELPSSEYYNYFLGNDPSKWKSNCRGFGKITLHNVYHGIDVEIITLKRRIKLNFLVKPFANPKDIQLQYDGLDKLKLIESVLHLETSVGKIQEMKPVSFQPNLDPNANIATNYVLQNNTVSFEVNNYNATYPLVIDPVIIFSTYSGSTADNWGYTATNDTFGNAFSGGSVHENKPFPITTGAFQTVWAGGFGGAYARDCGILKYSKDGKQLLYCTYIGGSSNEGPHSMICDDAGNLYLMGATWSTNFPTSANAYDKTHNGKADLFVTVLSSDGKTLIGSTLLGGSQNDGFNGTNDAQPDNEIYDTISNTPLAYNYGDYFRGEIMLDMLGNIFVISSTFSSNLQNFPLINAFQSTFGGKEDACFVKFNSNASILLQSSYLGGNGHDAGFGIGFDNFNNAYVCGGTTSTNLATVGGAFAYHGNGDAFVAKISSLGGLSKVICYGTSKYDQAFFLQFDNAYNVYITGQTEGNLPSKGSVTTNNYTRQYVTSFNRDLDSVVLSANFGVTGSEYPDISPSAFLVDICNRIYVSGWGGRVNWGNFNSKLGNTTGLYTSSDAFQKTTDGSDFYLIVFGPNLERVEYASFLGSPSSADHVDGGTSRFDKHGMVYQSVCGGCGGNDDFPTTDGAWSEVNNSNNCNNALFKMNLNTGGIPPVIKDTTLFTNIIDDTTFYIHPNDTFNFVFDVRDYYSLMLNTTYDGNILSEFPNTPTITKTVINNSFHKFRIKWNALCTNVGDTVILNINTSNNNCPNPLTSTATIRIVIEPLPPPNPPFPECIGNINDSTVELKWNDNGNNIKNIKNFHVYRKFGAANFSLLKTLPVTSTFLFDSSAVNHLKENYCYFLATEDICGDISVPSRLICSIYKEDTATSPGYIYHKDTIVYINAFDTLSYTDTIYDTDAGDSVYIKLSGTLLSTGRSVTQTYSGLGQAIYSLKWNALCEDITTTDTLKVTFLVYDNQCPTIRIAQGVLNVVVFSPPLITPPSLKCIRKITDNQVQIRWNNIPQDKYFSHYALLRKTSDGTISKIAEIHIDTISSLSVSASNHASINYCYALVPVNICGTYGDTGEFTCSVYPASAYPPEISFYTVTVEDNQSIVLKWQASQESNFSNYAIYRRTFTGSDRKLIVSGVTDSIWKDEKVQVMESSYCYLIKQTNDCGLESTTEEKEACSILLQGVSNPFVHQLNWNPYTYWTAGVQYQELLKLEDNPTPVKVTQIDDGNSNTYRDEGLNIDNGLYYYQIIAHEMATGFGYNSRSNQIELIQKPMVYTPNAFTPNGDNINDNWEPHPVFVKDYNLKIYSRWGELIFETNNKYETFNGQFLNNPSSVDAYVYIITYTGWDKSSHIQKGNLTILR